MKAIIRDWKLSIVEMKERYEKIGMTQMDIAEATGIKQSNISRFFSMRVAPNLRTFSKIETAISEFKTNKKSDG